jgi:hypothetical protein
MKKIFLQPLLVLVFLAILGVTVYMVPTIFGSLEDASYRYVVVFLILIAASNVLARIATKFINL